MKRLERDIFSFSGAASLSGGRALVVAFCVAAAWLAEAPRDTARAQTPTPPPAPESFEPTRVSIDRSTHPNGIAIIDAANARVLYWRRMDRYQLGLPPFAVLGGPGAPEAPAPDRVTSFKRPAAVAIGPEGALYVADRSMIVRFAPPLQTGAAGEIFAGAVEAGTSSTLLRNPAGLAFDSAGNLWAADTGNHRVLAYFGAARRSAGAAADFALGQLNFTASAPNGGSPRPNAQGFNTPLDVTVDARGDVYVADWANNRILRFERPLETDRRADLVYGQRYPFDFTSNAPNRDGIGPDTLYGPVSAQVNDRDWLLVSDNFNQRVLRFQIRSEADITADLVLGSPENPSRFAALPMALGNVSGLVNPFSADSDSIGRIFIADAGAHQALRYDGALAPALLQVDLIDTNGNGVGEAGETLSLVFPRAVRPAVLDTMFTAADFQVGGAPGSTLGGNFTVSRGPEEPERLRLRLGEGAFILPATGEGAGTLLDVSAALYGKIYEPETSRQIIPSSLKPVRLLFREAAAEIKPGGGSLALEADGTTRFSRHRLMVAPGALAAPGVFRLAPPANDYGFPSVVEIGYSADALVTLEISPDQVDYEAGQILKAFSFVRLNPSTGRFERRRATVKFDPLNYTMSASLNAILGGGGTPSTLSGIPKEIIGGLPDVVVEPEEIFIARRAPAAAHDSGGGEEMAVLIPGTEGLYTKHRIEFPDFVEGGAERKVTLRQARGYERYTFPENSGAIFAVESKPLLAPADRVNLEIEFIDSEQLSLTDLRDFAGQRGPAGKLRLVQFDLSLPGFAFVPASRYDRILLTQRGTIRVEGLRNFTATLPEVYGLVIQPNADELKVTYIGEPEPTPTPSPTPPPTESPTPEPSPTPSPTETETPTPSPTASPSPSPSASPSPSPSPSETPVPTSTAAPGPVGLLFY